MIRAGHRGSLLASLLVLLIAPGAVWAQPAPEPSPRYAEEPTDGVTLPTTGISGEADALAASQNPAGLHFLGGWHLALAVDLVPDEEEATQAGSGWGLFAASTLGGRILPRLGWGIGLEFLSPPRVALAPDPGSPTRFTYAMSLPMGRLAALGVGWHHFFDETGAPLRGLDTFDLGAQVRWSAFLATGFMLRDLGQPTVAGAPVERRYELEVATRPTGDDRLELAVGGRLGEIRTDFTDGSDIDGWLRGSWRVVRGVYLRAEVENRSIFQLEPGPSGVDTSERRETRVVGGLELSFGGMGTAAYASTAFDDDGDGRFSGLSAVMRVSEEDVPSVLSRDRRIEQIELKGDINERELTRLMAQLRLLSRDDAVAAVLVTMDSPGLGWAGANEVRQGLAAVRAAGKKVFVYMVQGTTKDYFLATVADKIYVDPAGGLRLAGMSATSLYFKGLFDKLGVVAQFEKIEEYKSAPEAWTRTGPTEPAAVSRNELYDSMYEHVVQEIGGGRRIDPARVRVLIDNGPYTSGELRKIPDLVDRVVTAEQLPQELVRELGEAVPLMAAPRERDERWDYPTIAVIYIDGDIVDGKSATIPILGIRLTGGETISAAIAAARASPQVEAIILRINSPGGSALASELMAREVFKTRGVKPIICSMGDIAASGGYFAAAGCDTILADPLTITGSIGIFNGKFDFSGLLGKFGITWSTYKRGQLADMDSWVRPWDENELKLLKRKLHYYYGRFIRAVAEGRNMSTGQVDAVGRGRVWTGLQAKPISLIDRFGNIGDAVQLAKRRVGLSPDDEVRLVLLPQESTSLLGVLLGAFTRTDAERQQEAERSLLEKMLPLGASRALLGAIPGSVWYEPGVPQARLPFSIVWDD
jgi:protease-4